MGAFSIAAAAYVMKQPKKPLRWEGEEVPADAKGPGFGQPVPKLEDRFPINKMKKKTK